MKVVGYILLFGSLIWQALVVLIHYEPTLLSIISNGASIIAGAILIKS